MTGLSTDPQARRAHAASVPPPDSQSPADRYAELFIAVQSGNVFDDSKTFVDCAPIGEPETILSAYRADCQRANFDLKAFVARHFKTQAPANKRSSVAPGLPMARHIDELWDDLTRHPAHHPPRGSLLQLPHPYVVPGGRFVEMYYWDSYFTMLGLAGAKHEALLHAMTDNFAYLIDTYGHVPNGTRTYYQSRSQPPVFALMAELCESSNGQGAIRYLPQMIREHAFWMDGAAQLSPGQAHRRVVALSDGALLNRYWDDRDTPREESWREDVATAAMSSRPAAEVYRDLRAAAESGWDFSSRWADSQESGRDRKVMLCGLRTTSIVPVDLNALLHKLETTVARLSAAAGLEEQAATFARHATERQAAMTQHLWHDDRGVYLDYDWARREPRKALNAAAVTPLFTASATQAQADALAVSLGAELLAPGGLSTTGSTTGEQWDRPNGWAPLQWMAVCGLAHYGHTALADKIRTRWIHTVTEVYEREGRLVEKYALRPTPEAEAAGGGGGEYPLQVGFGWTNGVMSQWL
ncbi:MAG: alpha,alpha-trehalase TreF [Comamonadaceae bacterium]|nr:MAG: alpha,alpha-trehalase TreF [Comamonadaceae bacterium]